MTGSTYLFGPGGPFHPPGDLPLACAEAALLAYFATPTWSAAGCEALAVDIPSPIHGHLFGVSFRGTNDLADAGVDLWAIPRRHPKLGWVHTGFARGVDAVHPKIVADLPDRGVPIIVDGHSKGGPEAIFEAARLVLDGYNVKYVIVFNPPRCTMGTRVLEILAGAGVVGLRIVARGDPVSHLPPFVLGYSHLFDAVYVGQGWDVEPDHPMKSTYFDLLTERQARKLLSPDQVARNRAWADSLKKAA